MKNVLSTWSTGGGCSALGCEMPYSKGGKVMVTTADGMAVPTDPETELMLVGAYPEASEDEGKVVEILGREGLNRWYLENVGYSPDADAGSSIPINELLMDVAEMLYLHTFGE